MHKICISLIEIYDSSNSVIGLHFYEILSGYSKYENHNTDIQLFFNAVTFIGFLYTQLLSSHLSWQEMVQIYNEIPTMFTKK